MTDALGLLAGSFVFGTFAMQSMIWLRLFAVASNVCFIFYGASLGLAPIWILHAILLPMNAWHLLRNLRPHQAETVSG